MGKRILISTGGTGGHVYPAMALAKQLMDDNPLNQVLFIGGGLSTNRYFNNHCFKFHTVTAAYLSQKSPLNFLKAVFSIGKGIVESFFIIRKFKPDVAIGFGSYYSFPPLIAAKFCSIPLVLHEANSIPGKVNRLLSRWAIAVGVHFPKTIDLLKGNCIEVGMPLREGFKKGITSSTDARAYFGLNPTLKTLLVFGGSQGASAINKKIVGALLNIKDIQVIHIAGNELEAKELRQDYIQANIKASVKGFENNMELAWQAADVVICRSGACTIAELFEFEVPSILIPYPKAADNHQKFNAQFIEEQVKGGLLLKEDLLNEQTLQDSLKNLFDRENESLEIMRDSIRKYKKNLRKQDLCSLIKQVLSC